MPITAGFDNTQSSPVSEERRWAVGGFRLRVRSSSVCGTVHGRRFLDHTHTRCSPCPFHFSGFPNVPVYAPARLWGVEWEVTRGEWRHWKQPSTPSDNLSSHCVSMKPQLKVSKGRREQVCAGWIICWPNEKGKPRMSIQFVVDINCSMCDN